VGVEVDEARAEHQARGIDDVALDAVADRRDAAAVDTDVGVERRAVARVDLGATEDEHRR
jgi:hypothetical protein